jgi:hypothetical protein
MSSDDDNNELKKAKYYYEAVLKLHELSQKSYERTNKKIDILIGVLSTVIPILTGIGYVVLSSTLAVSFFVVYLFSLSTFVWALAKCVHLLAPRRFFCVDVGKLMKKHDKKPLSYIIFKVSSTWEDTVKKNFAKINSLGVDLEGIVRLIIIGLGLLVVSFLLLGVEFYLMEHSADPTALLILLPF